MLMNRTELPAAPGGELARALAALFPAAGGAFPGEERRPVVAVAGLGLIGGSLALALKEHGALCRVLGVDRDADTLRAARETGAADETALPGEADAPLSRAAALVLALPPRAAADFLREHAAVLPRGALVTDVCGVKRAVVEACAPLCREYGLCFVGGHPMAGKEKSGFAHAAGGLFRGAPWLLTPPPGTPPQAAAAAEALARAAGCGSVLVTTPEHHDAMIAFTSQLPHVLAGAYVKSPRCPEHRGYSAGSFRDVSRVAAVDETLWTQLFLDNADNLCREIDELMENLRACRDAVAAGDAERLAAVLREGRERKESVSR